MFQYASWTDCLFPTLKKGEGEATFHEGREEKGKRLDIFTCQKLLAMIVGSKGPGKRGHIVADTLLRMMFLGREQNQKHFDFDFFFFWKKIKLSNKKKYTK